VKGFAAKLNVNSALYAELQALLIGLKMAMPLSTTRIQINTDSTEVIKVIQNGHDSFTNIISECRELLRLMGIPQISHSRRQQNQLADILAKEGSRLKQDVDFVEWIVSPVFALKALGADMERTTFDKHIVPPLQSDSTNDNVVANLDVCNVVDKLNVCNISGHWLCNDAYYI